jgi:hypothetical protein
MTHFDGQGQAHRVDVSAKAETRRVARIAAIQGAKRTPDLAPLCPPLPITRMAVDFEIDASRRTAHFGAAGTRYAATVRSATGRRASTQCCRGGDDRHSIKAYTNAVGDFDAPINHLSTGSLMDELNFICWAGAAMLWGFAGWAVKIGKIPNMRFNGEPVYRADHPFIFWITIVICVGLGLGYVYVRYMQDLPAMGFLFSSAGWIRFFVWMAILAHWGGAVWAMKTGRMEFKGTVVRRDEHPYLFWFAVATYVGLGSYILLYFFF